MAKTDGRRNPPWTRDETILALDLFYDAGLVALSDSDHRVIELSNTLRGLPGNEGRATSPSFRNPAGVAFKLSNLQSIATGKGFSNVSAIDISVWKDFENRSSRVKDIVQLIKAFAPSAPIDHDIDEDDAEFMEGSIVTRTHKRIERSKKVRSKLISERTKKGPLHCDACLIQGSTDGRLKDAIFEAHHLVPLSTLGSTITKISDVSLLCANCHRTIHRLISRSGRWVSIDDLRLLLNNDHTE
ncbi:MULTISPECIES: HNH endonuclease [unclassified Luteibacter]|uniref:HNH endonuclease n=1 Tax=Luteibacter sp. PvP019 TaxID=3156436 RepID=UPI003397B48A